ncbi:hypothetical protein AMR42_15600 [Limnothrix sp. PR1529]|nr:hypothetical protein BCR12_18645 [Limnothrix sp. P13C2]PIB05632.1 hypothetical protein AMR42_15600 [Limnothrix sp. PR1529]
MSPFLIHMTGKKEILSILQGKSINDLDDVEESDWGFLESCIPENKSDYKAKVVCFTESPTFALDFFRRRKKTRWVKDQRFGLGFSKASLVRAGVRPVIYLDQPMIQKINKIFNDLERQEQEKNIDQASEELLDLVRKFYPLVFPILESNRFQGFMWEREWRMVSETGFSFKHSDLRIICCPEEEQGAIEDILQVNKDHIQFVRSWQEYNDVTDFLNRQSKIWEEKNSSIKFKKTIGEPASVQLQKLLDEYQSTLKTLKERQDFIASLQEEHEMLKEQIFKINQGILDCQRQIEEENLRKRDQSRIALDTLQGVQDSLDWDIPF